MSIILLLLFSFYLYSEIYFLGVFSAASIRKCVTGDDVCVANSLTRIIQNRNGKLINAELFDKIGFQRFNLIIFIVENYN